MDFNLKEFKRTGLKQFERRLESMQSQALERSLIRAGDSREVTEADRTGRDTGKGRAWTEIQRLQLMHGRGLVAIGCNGWACLERTCNLATTPSRIRWNQAHKQLIFGLTIQPARESEHTRIKGMWMPQVQLPPIEKLDRFQMQSRKSMDEPRNVDMAGRWMFGRGLRWEELEFRRIKLEGVRESLKRRSNISLPGRMQVNTNTGEFDELKLKKSIQNAHVKLNAVAEVELLDWACTPADQNWLSEGNEASGGVDLNRSKRMRSRTLLRWKGKVEPGRISNAKGTFGDNSVELYARQTALTIKPFKLDMWAVELKLSLNQAWFAEGIVAERRGEIWDNSGERKSEQKKGQRSTNSGVLKPKTGTTAQEAKDRQIKPETERKWVVYVFTDIDAMDAIATVYIVYCILVLRTSKHGCRETGYTVLRQAGVGGFKMMSAEGTGGTIEAEREYDLSVSAPRKEDETELPNRDEDSGETNPGCEIFVSENREAPRKEDETELLNRDEASGETNPGCEIFVSENRESRAGARKIEINFKESDMVVKSKPGRRLPTELE
ncbi:hypothetical protein C8R44DRAFT_754746 [Mycena epipterygia]|nr:hypothetical protein C8R44DRAFT_754746 [Mycena epipterygia]